MRSTAIVGLISPSIILFVLGFFRARGRTAGGVRFLTGACGAVFAVKVLAFVMLTLFVSAFGHLAFQTILDQDIAIDELLVSLLGLSAIVAGLPSDIRNRTGLLSLPDLVDCAWIVAFGLVVGGAAALLPSIAAGTIPGLGGHHLLISTYFAPVLALFGLAWGFLVPALEADPETRRSVWSVALCTVASLPVVTYFLMGRDGNPVIRAAIGTTLFIFAAGLIRMRSRSAWVMWLAPIAALMVHSLVAVLS